MEDVSEENEATTPAWKHWLANGVGVVCLLSALTMLTTIVGWNVPEDQEAWLEAGTRGTAALFFFYELLRMIFRQGSIWQRFAKLRFGCLPVLLTVVMAVAYTPLHGKLAEAFPKVSPHTLAIAYFAVLNALILWTLVLRGIRFRKTFLKGLPLTPGRVFILSFIFLVVAGTLLLKTPNASVSGISWCDALFLSTSAVCVTGLSPFDIALGLTFHGQCIVLILLQLGGLGVMSITYFFAYFFAGGLSLKNRFDFQDLFSENNIGQIGTVLAVIVGFTLAAEAAGAMLIYFSSADLLGATERPIFFAVFHSISAFCNAGLSCVPGAMTDPRLSGNMAMISSVFMMSLIGGLGFPVIKNFWMFFTDKLRARLRKKSVERVPVRLTTHTKIVLAATFGLFVFGFVSFFLLDRTGGAESLRRAFFLAGTSRTAGFDIATTGALSSAAKMLLMALMFIGGSPFSTAGGIKTTTFVVALLSLRQFVLGRRDLEVFGRRLNSDIANQALAIVLVGMIMVFVVATTLCAMHPNIPFENLLFEAVSAFGTVGLSCGVTSQLGDPAKYVVAAAMFIGRIGVLLFITSFLPRRRTTVSARLPETSIVLS